MKYEDWNKKKVEKQKFLRKKKLEVERSRLEEKEERNEKLEKRDFLQNWKTSIEKKNCQQNILEEDKKASTAKKINENFL